MDDKLSTDKNDFLKEIGDAEKLGIIEDEEKKEITICGIVKILKWIKERSF